MAHTWILVAAVLAAGAATATPIPAYSQLDGEHREAITILNSMPPDVLAKVQALAQILQQSINAGKLSDTEIRQGMLSGRLAEKLKQLSPEADQLFQEIGTATKDGTGPSEDSVLPLLRGLGGQPN